MYLFEKISIATLGAKLFIMKKDKQVDMLLRSEQKARVFWIYGCKRGG